jgi:hypothetical protein
MATGRSSFAKRQRDMAKKAKAQAKRAKRLEGSDDDNDVEEEDTGPTMPNDEVMRRIEDLHRRYDDGQMDLDTFDEERAALMAQITVD